MRHASRPPDVAKLLGVLKEHDVAYVLIGSVGLHAYGLEVSPGDLDITPALETRNLHALAYALTALEAQLDPEAPAGHWEESPHGEKTWVSEPLTDELRAARASWAPNPSRIASFDHLFHSRYGNFDVVPTLLGRYEVLLRRAVSKHVHDHEVRVMHIDALLAGLTVPRRTKDAERVTELRRLQASL
jgi:hypothetical protein